MRLQNNRQLELLAYKLLNDALMLWLVVFFVLLILEGTVPGYFSAYLSFTKMIVVLFALLASIACLGKRNEINFKFTFEKKLLKNKTALVLFAISLILIVNSVKSLNIFEIVVIFSTLVITVFYFYKIFTASENNS